MVGDHSKYQVMSASTTSSPLAGRFAGRRAPPPSPLAAAPVRPQASWTTSGIWTHYMRFPDKPGVRPDGCHELIQADVHGAWPRQPRATLRRHPGEPEAARDPPNGLLSWKCGTSIRVLVAVLPVPAPRCIFQGNPGLLGTPGTLRKCPRMCSRICSRIC